MSLPKFPEHPDILTSFPTPQILLVQINRPKALNAITSAMHLHLHRLFELYDNTPSLRCAIITGANAPAARPIFSAGADLKEWLGRATAPADAPPPRTAPSGFMGLSRRVGKKPVVGAVSGVCFGGGFEAVIGGCDLVVADVNARFALPETKRGVVAIAGALPRLVRAVGWQRASQLALADVEITAEEAKAWGLVGWVVNGGVLEKAIEIAKTVAGMSPDSVIVTREGLRSGLEGVGVEEATVKVMEGVYKGLEAGENVKEGLRAFVEKREVRWVDSKL